MQWLVRTALRLPYTFIVLGVLIAFLGIFTAWTTPKDVLPVIDIPVVTIIWSYTGISPEDMEKRMVTVTERALTTTVSDIEHIESQSLTGVAVIRIFFHPNAPIQQGIAETSALCQTLLKIMPPGTTAPAILQYNASSVPILQLGLQSDSLTEQQLYDYGLNFIRTQLATVQGASVPLPYGGKSPLINVDLDPAALLAKGLSPAQVNTALSNQNIILPAGTVKLGGTEYQVRVNSSPLDVTTLNQAPIKMVNGAPILLGDVATVHQGNAVQTNVVTINGRRSALLTVLKSGSSSTLDIVDRVKGRLPQIQATLPGSLQIKQLFDQSIFVRAAVGGVVREAVIAALLTSLMILLFLGSWRSTVVVCTSIPLAILTSIIVLGHVHMTLNVMSLGGLALAVGILVDDATVEIENMHRNLGMNKGLRQAILDGAQQIATPTFISTLSICLVFVSVVFLTGPAKFLFTPMAVAVVFAMLASYLLSRTVVPVMVRMLLKPEIQLYRAEASHHAMRGKQSLLWRVHHRFNNAFERFRIFYGRWLAQALRHRRLTVVLFVAFFLGSAALLPFVGEDFFPTVDAGQLRLHVRAPAGTRLEETLKQFHSVETAIRQIIPASELSMVVDNIGIPASGINLGFSDNPVVGPNDGEILVALTDHHRPGADYMEAMREQLPALFPNMTFFFLPADIVTQILNFGTPASLDVQVVGRTPDVALAQKLVQEISTVPGAVDVHLHQVLDAPTLDVNVDRMRAGMLGVQEADVTNSVLLSLSGSGQVSPGFWLNPKNGVNYQVQVQTPQYRIESLDDLLRTPITPSATPSPSPATPLSQQLNNLALVQRGHMQANISHYNVQPTLDVLANVQGRDLGGVARDVQRILDKYRPHLQKGMQLAVRGQVQSMQQSFRGLGFGLLFAIVLVYLLMVVNFQSWVDPLIILMALPGGLAGVIWMLFLTRTTFSVPSLMGAIMTVGVGIANSILMVTFANDQRDLGDNASMAAWQAGLTRLRPVLMTALAMIIGMAPMAFAMGEGGEQNAPLGRAVIGGLMVATFTTLFLVPVAYSALRRKPLPDLDPPDEEDGKP